MGRTGEKIVFRVKGGYPEMLLAVLQTEVQPSSLVVQIIGGNSGF